MTKDPSFEKDFQKKDHQKVFFFLLLSSSSSSSFFLHLAKYVIFFSSFNGILQRKLLPVTKCLGELADRDPIRYEWCDGRTRLGDHLQSMVNTPNEEVELDHKLVITLETTREAHLSKTAKIASPQLGGTSGIDQMIYYPWMSSGPTHWPNPVADSADWIGCWPPAV